MPRYFAVGISAHNYAVAFTAEVARMCDVETRDSLGVETRCVRDYRPPPQLRPLIALQPKLQETQIAASRVNSSPGQFLMLL